MRKVRKLAVAMLVCSASLFAASDMASAQGGDATPYCEIHLDLSGTFCLLGCESQPGCDCVAGGAYWSKCCCTVD